MTLEHAAEATEAQINPEMEEQPSTSDTKEEVEETILETNDQDVQLTRVASGPLYTIFSYRARVFILALVSISALISPFGATTFYPALNVLARDLHVTPSLINLSLTTYMIAQAIAPSIIAGMSDTSGRRPSFLICFCIYIAANIGLALQTNYAALMVLRMVQASGCSAAIALTTAVVADISTSAERGRFMAYATAGLLIGPSFGPTIGGLLAEYLGWRSIFWFLAIFTGIMLAVFTCFFPETCRNVVGNGSIPAKGLSLSVLGYVQQRKHARETDSIAGDLESVPDKPRRKHNFPNPLNTLKILGEKGSCLVLFYNGLFFMGMMVTSASIPHLYSHAYNLNELDIGLCYITQGIGSLIATQCTGHACDWNFRRHARRVGLEIRKGRQQDLTNFPIEVVRFQIVIFGHIIGTSAILAFGWCVHYRVALAAPEIALFFIGFGVSGAFNLSNALLLDFHRDKPATATAAVNLVRCLLSAAGAAVIIPLSNAINPGWAFTVVAGILALSSSMIYFVMKNGQRWRRELAEKKQRLADATARAAAEADVESVPEKDEDKRDIPSPTSESRDS